MTTNNPDQDQIQQNTAGTVLLGDVAPPPGPVATVAASIPVESSPALTGAVNTAGLNSLSEAAVNKEGTVKEECSVHGDENHQVNVNRSCVAEDIAVEQQDQVIPVHVPLPAPEPTPLRSPAPPSDSRKLDMVLMKLDDILVRLSRLEGAIASSDGSGTASKSSAARVIKTKTKNILASMVKTAQGAPVEEVNLHYYDNGYHVLPEGWILPRLSFEGLMMYWYFGDPSAGVPPLIKVAGTEFKNLPRGVRKRSDMKYLMKHVERKGKNENCFIDNLNDWTPDSVRNLYARTKQFFEYPNKSSAQTKFDKLSWETVCHNVRRNKGILVGEEAPAPAQLINIDNPIPIPSTEPEIPAPSPATAPIATTEQTQPEQAQPAQAPSEKTSPEQAPQAQAIVPQTNIPFSGNAPEVDVIMTDVPPEKMPKHDVLHSI